MRPKSIDIWLFMPEVGHGLLVFIVVPQKGKLVRFAKVVGGLMSGQTTDCSAFVEAASYADED